MNKTNKQFKDMLSGGSIFSAIKNVKDFPFFVENDPQKLDTILMSFYGKRWVFEPYEEMDLNTLAEIIVMAYQSKWDGLLGVDVTKLMSGRTKRITETVENDQVTINETDGVNKTATFDSATMFDTDGNTTNQNEKVDGNKKREYLEEISEAQNVYKNLTLIEKNNIIKTVLKDVSSFITLSIY